MESTQFLKFKKVLETVFMLDHAELDFGIYRIMNQKREEINQYLDNVLPKQVTEVLENNSGQRRKELQSEIDKASQQAKGLGIDPDTVPAVKDLKAQMAEIGSIADLENSVYSHLSTFFSRYYDGGDFLSQRRYKKDVYAIPYEGEEVKLYWANADQYYIKTGEYFRTYSFKLGSGKRVEFTLKEASTEQNNNLSQKNMERRFALYEETPVEVVDNTLHINFTYELMPKAIKQKDLITAAYNTIKTLIPRDFADALAPRPTESDKYRTLLQKHLTDYVARNTFDYFIHKDLQGFLSRELDFYIKNEVLFIDDIDAQHENKFLNHLSVIKSLKAIGGKIITFLSSIENFQKKLWLKKKFVTECNYCITLDRIPEEMYEEIAGNDAQREEWGKLFAIDEIVDANGASNSLFTSEKASYSNPLSIQFLKENPFLVLDTKFFPTKFKHRLIESIHNIDEQCDGVMIKSENFQALELLREKYKQQIKCIYIDPPYNAQSSEILYKNTYKDSSWISLMNDRLFAGKSLLSADFVHFVAIDEVEQIYLGSLINSVFDEKKNICISIVHNPRGQQGKNISYIHEYAFITYPGDKNKYLADVKRLEIDSRNLRDSGTESDRTDAATCFYPIIVRNGDVFGFGKVPEDDFHPLSNNVQRKSGDLEIWPLDDDGNEKKWRYSVSTVATIKDKLTVKMGRNNYQIIFNQDVGTMKSLWTGAQYDASEYGTKVIQSILGEKIAKQFNYPKSINTVTECISIGLNGASNTIILDYFAGSGTTAHAVINLNREDEGNRKYILVEMGDYFNTVTKPRIEKVIYSKDWKNGKPVSREGSSHCFKYMSLEQYEDTLNNLVLKRDGELENDKFKESYLLGYMLDTESRGSLFNTEWFVNPFDVKLKITQNNETEEQVIDLVETFNYLIGLNVDSIAWPKDGICVVAGITRRGEKSLVIWRDCNKIDNNALISFFEKSAYSTKDNEFDRIYVNGDNTLENIKKEEDSWKVVLIEEEFSKQMFIEQ